MPISSSDQRTPTEQSRIYAELTELFEKRITFNEFLGFKIEQLEKRPFRVSFDMRPELVGHYQYGRLHGGVISSALDATGGMAVMIAITDFHKADDCETAMARFAKLGTIDMRVDYLREGKGKKFYAVGEVVRLGRRIGATRMMLVNENNTLIATANANYIVS